MLFSAYASAKRALEAVTWLLSPPKYHLSALSHPIIICDQDTAITAESLAGITGDTQVLVGHRVAAIHSGSDGASGADADTAFRMTAIRRKDYLSKQLVFDCSTLYRRRRGQSFEQKRTRYRNLFVTVGLLLWIFLQASHHAGGGTGRAFPKKREKLTP